MKESFRLNADTAVKAVHVVSVTSGNQIWVLGLSQKKKYKYHLKSNLLEKIGT